MCAFFVLPSATVRCFIHKLDFIHKIGRRKRYHGLDFQPTTITATHNHAATVARAGLVVGECVPPPQKSIIFNSHPFYS